MARLFNLDMQLLHDTLLLAIAVFVLFLALSYLLFNPVRKMLEDRKNKIAKDLSDAAADKEEAAKSKAEYDIKLQAADKEAEALLAEARQKATRSAAKTEADAKEEAARIIARANEEAALEKKKVADELKNEMVEVAAAMAAKVVSANIDTNIQNSLIDETLKEIGDSTWQS